MNRKTDERTAREAETQMNGIIDNIIMNVDRLTKGQELVFINKWIANRVRDEQWKGQMNEQIPLDQLDYEY